MMQNIAKYVIKHPDLVAQKIERLCRGLDDQSRNNVNMIISRLIKSYHSPSHIVDDLGINEMTELREIRTYMLNAIIKIHENLYSYNGYLLPINCFGTNVFWYKHGLHIFHTDTIARIKHLDIVDVGGFIGDSALIFQDITTKNIHTFEATKTNYNLMQKTIELNHAERVIPVNYGLGSKAEKRTISVFGGASSILERHYNDSREYEEIEIMTLDSYVEQHNIKIGLIKVDIEGFEMEFLKGALNTIKTQKPAMIISIYHQEDDFFDIKPFIESLDLGYSFKIYKPLDFTISIETALYCEAL